MLTDDDLVKEEAKAALKPSPQQQHSSLTSEPSIRFVDDDATMLSDPALSLEEQAEEYNKAEMSFHESLAASQANFEQSTADLEAKQRARTRVLRGGTVTAGGSRVTSKNTRTIIPGTLATSEQDAIDKSKAAAAVGGRVRRAGSGGTKKSHSSISETSDQASPLNSPISVVPEAVGAIAISGADDRAMQVRREKASLSPLAAAPPVVLDSASSSLPPVPPLTTEQEPGIQTSTAPAAPQALAKSQTNNTSPGRRMDATGDFNDFSLELENRKLNRLSPKAKRGIGIVLLVIVLIAVIIPVVIVVTSKDDSSSKDFTPEDSLSNGDSGASSLPTPTTLSNSPSPTILIPTSAPSLAPTSQAFQDMVAFVTPITSLSDSSAFSDPSSPQYQAVEWMVEDEILDGLSQPLHDVEKLERYILVVLYFSMLDGPYMKDVVNPEQFSLSRDTLYLSHSVHHCQWINPVIERGPFRAHIDCKRGDTTGIPGASPNRVALVDFQSLLALGDLPDEIGHLEKLDSLVIGTYVYAVDATAHTE